MNPYCSLLGVTYAFKTVQWNLVRVMKYIIRNHIVFGVSTLYHGPLWLKFSCRNNHLISVPNVYLTWSQVFLLLDTPFHNLMVTPIISVYLITVLCLPLIAHSTTPVDFSTHVPLLSSLSGRSVPQTCPTILGLFRHNITRFFLLICKKHSKNRRIS